MTTCMFDQLSCRFTFGKMEGCSLGDVLDICPDYLDWCMDNATNVLLIFCAPVLDEIRAAYPDFIMGDAFLGKRSNVLIVDL